MLKSTGNLATGEMHTTEAVNQNQNFLALCLVLLQMKTACVFVIFERCSPFTESLVPHPDPCQGHCVVSKNWSHFPPTVHGRLASFAQETEHSPLLHFRLHACKNPENGPK